LLAVKSWREKIDFHARLGRVDGLSQMGAHWQGVRWVHTATPRGEQAALMRGAC